MVAGFFALWYSGLFRCLVIAVICLKQVLIYRRWKIKVIQLLPNFQILLTFGSVLSCHIVKTHLFKIMKWIGKSEILTAYIVNDALAFEKVIIRILSHCGHHCRVSSYSSVYSSEYRHSTFIFFSEKLHFWFCHACKCWIVPHSAGILPTPPHRHTAKASNFIKKRETKHIQQTKVSTW